VNQRDFHGIAAIPGSGVELRPRFAAKIAGLPLERLSGLTDRRPDAGEREGQHSPHLLDRGPPCAYSLPMMTASTAPA
jgi:hypothetical protein